MIFRSKKGVSMAVIYPTLENIQRLKVKPTAGEWYLTKYLKDHLDDSYEVFFNPSLDGDRPDIVILKEYSAAFIIEVKDWNLENYKVSGNNRWKVTARTKDSPIKSPHAQVFSYKKNLYDLHLPVLGLNNLTNKNFFNLVHCFVYFHKSSQDEMKYFYSPAELEVKNQQEKNNQFIKKSRGALYVERDALYVEYEKENEKLDGKRKKLQRDKAMSIGCDGLPVLIKKIKDKSRSHHVLFDEEVYRDFKRRLSPSDHTLKQGIKVAFDKQQDRLTGSKARKEKLKGVAGCGKSTILAQRAINAHQRHKSQVLILTFNITLKNYIKDKISDIQGHRDLSNFDVSNYHQFFNSQINNTEQDIEELVNKHKLERLYSFDVFKDKDTEKYHTILVDEVQDYDSNWIKIIRDNFLEENGEMVLFGDESQTIYEREVAFSSTRVQGFGRWMTLKRSYRTDFDSPLNHLFKDFQIEYLVSKYIETEVFETRSLQFGLSYSLLKYESVPAQDWEEKIYDSIASYIRVYDLHPNDVVILCSKKMSIRHLEFFWSKQEKTNCMIATYSEIAKILTENIDKLAGLPEEKLNKKLEKIPLEKIERTKKNHFYPNKGVVKLSTCHSFKGLECKTVFYVMHKEDTPELIYTAITRSSENLVIFDIGNNNKCSAFFVTSPLITKTQL